MSIYQHKNSYYLKYHFGPLKPFVFFILYYFRFYFYTLLKFVLWPLPETKLSYPRYILPRIPQRRNMLHLNYSTG